MKESATLYKLMILYMLGQVKFPLTNSQMLEFFLDNNYTDYFTFQTVVSELVQNGLIQSESILNSSHYTLTESGEETLHFFGNTISSQIRSEIDTFLNENKVKLRKESGVTADYHRQGEGYLVRCQIKEGDDILFCVEISVPTEQQALTVCSNWSRTSQDLYSTAVNSLFK